MNQLEKELQRAQGKIKLMLKSCRQLEGEKETSGEGMAMKQAVGLDAGCGPCMVARPSLRGWTINLQCGSQTHC